MDEHRQIGGLQVSDAGAKQASYLHCSASLQAQQRSTFAMLGLVHSVITHLSTLLRQRQASAGSCRQLRGTVGQAVAAGNNKG